MEAPTPEEIKAARKKAGLKLREAADAVHAHLGSWQKWEGGHRPMALYVWELFLLKTGQKKLEIITKSRPL